MWGRGLDRLQLHRLVVFMFFVVVVVVLFFFCLFFCLFSFCYLFFGVFFLRFAGTWAVHDLGHFWCSIFTARVRESLPNIHFKNIAKIPNLYPNIDSDITNGQLGFSEETVFLRQESPCLLIHLTPSSGSSDNLSHTTLLHHQVALALAAMLIF